MAFSTSNPAAPVLDKHDMAEPIKPSAEGFPLHADSSPSARKFAEGENAKNFCRVVVRPAKGGEEGKAGEGSKLAASSQALEIQKLLSEQSPATAKRLIFSATKTTTTTCTLTKTVGSGGLNGCVEADGTEKAEAEENAKGPRWFSAAADMVQMGWKATKEALLTHASTAETQADEVEREIARFVPSVQVVDLPLHLSYTVPEVKTRMVHYTFECPARGCSRLVPRAFPVDTPFIVPQFQDVRVPVVMSQTFVPELHESAKIIQVPVARYVPKLVPVDVYVPRPVAVPIKAEELRQVTKSAEVSPELLHQLSVEMNPHLEALNQFNARQAEVFNQVVNKANELAARVEVEPPAPERIEVDAASTGVRSVVDEQGCKRLEVDVGGKDPKSLEVTFNRLQEDVNPDKRNTETVNLTEDVILSVYRDLDGGHLNRFPSGNVGIPMVYRAPEQTALGLKGPSGEPARLASLTDELGDGEGTSATTTGDASLPGAAVGPEESTTTVARPDSAPTPLSD
ncbi:alveolin domain containing intermediate filament IMC7 [Besnoitia besnoiti]|uniref:Alveolin domain containing intermediate filament IMC7 n=1 Tax=Besnoitia besnoiti TaxID=94643 RepID=A0A2A9M6Z1_BESBE|nr:alveolin domain containing intermediate filament IMC7 [Besnoitia besnoiti]PFH33765.1 alveolin domain containing intermediate filament IMC7 [Besnoitia besnoiti]